MVSRWYSSISDFDDILRFQNHIWDINRDCGERGIALGEREFPASLFVQGRAYPVMKEKALLAKRREFGAIFGAISSLLSGPAGVATTVAKQTIGYIWEGWEDRKDEVRKAAAGITLSYYGIRDDTDLTMSLDYVYTSDNPYEDPPILY